MKNSILHTAVFLLLAVGLTAQNDTLAPAMVWDSLYQQLSIGQNLVQLHSDEKFTAAGASLADQLTTGTPLNQYGAGTGLLSNPSLRGNHADGTQVFWNGMPVNSPLLGTSDLNLFSAASFDQVSVISGGNGSELGSGAMGGSVLLRNRLRFSPSRKIEARLGIGSFGRKTASAGFEHFTPKFSYQVNALAMGAENNFSFSDPFERERNMKNSRLHHAALQASAGRRWKNSRLESHFLAQDIYRQIPASSIVYNPQAPEDAWESDQQFRWQNIYQQGKLRIEQGFGLERQHYQRDLSGIDSRNDFFQSSTELRYVALKRKSWQWDLGGYGNYYQSFGSNVKADQWEYGANTGVTYRPASRWLTRASVSEHLVDQQHMAVLPSLAVEFYLNEYLSFKTRHNGIFNNPTLNERYWPGGGKPDLLPETGYNGEISAVYQLNRQAISLKTSLTLFHQRVENKVVWLPNAFSYTPYNINRTRNQGVEIYSHVEKKLWKGHRLQGGLSGSFTDARVITASSGEDFKEGSQLVYVPRWQAGSWLNYKVQAFSLYLSGNYNSGAYTSADNDPFNKLHSFVVINAGASYRIKLDRWSLVPAFQLRNLTNTAYELNSYRPMPGINYIFNLKLIHSI